MEDNKKPGQRDISDLKARLGLKKTAAMPAVTPAGAPQPSAAPVPAPIPAPVANVGSGPAIPAPIPSPFGQPAPQPAPAPVAQPAAPPDPRRDPFAQQQAANLAAFYGIGQTLPGDASAVDAAPVSQPKAWGSIITTVIAAGVALVAGVMFGAINKERNVHNQTVADAAKIRSEVERLQKQLNNIADTINASAATKQGQPDFDMTKKLGDLDLKKPDTQKLFHTNYSQFEDAAIERLFNYYDHTIKLYDAITVHAKKTDNDKDAIESYLKNGAGKGDKNYGVTLDMSGPIPFAHFAEIGSPECQQPDKTDCPANELKGFKFRADGGASWGSRPIKGKPTEIVFVLQKSPLFGSVAAGNPDILAYKDYLRRIVEIKGLAQNLVAEQKDLLKDLSKSAEKPTLFAF